MSEMNDNELDSRVEEFYKKLDGYLSQGELDDKAELINSEKPKLARPFYIEIVGGDYSFYIERDHPNRGKSYIPTKASQKRLSSILNKYGVVSIDYDYEHGYYSVCFQSTDWED